MSIEGTCSGLPDVDPEVEKAWAQIADQREAELESGAALEIPDDEAIARLRLRIANI